ncbi:LysR substrate-binding domain-containing protein [Xanthobacteraceae bacterium Astr-EGSB]|uniref:LysR substrate-binding domain-containing protein n=1 Tax=Astrobacterium formosum TaxID=3069710 RepID=UPI0027B65BA9|nr:LysR substrate-binding domain-containing protein [Xanthobacteraceae bacterium Astr-EGSB]
MHHFDMEALATFVAVVDANGFTAAGKRIGKTQAAVSMAIARLEGQLDAKLLDRAQRGVDLTDDGQILVGYARRMLTLQDDALAALRPHRFEGRVRLGMPDDYLNTFGATVMDQFLPQNPRIQVEIVCDFSYSLEHMLERGDIDLALITRGTNRNLGEFLREEPLVWCSSRDHRPELVDPLPLALFPEGCRARPHVLDALNRAGRPWRIAWTSSHLPSIQSAIVQGRAVTALPSSIVSPDYRRLGNREGMPELKPVELAMLVPPVAKASVRRLASFLRVEAQQA